jgi:hypothetical protein
MHCPACGEHFGYVASPLVVETAIRFQEPAHPQLAGDVGHVKTGKLH